MKTRSELIKTGVTGIIFGLILEGIYLTFLSNSTNALGSMIGVAIGVAGPILFIYGIVQFIRGLVKSKS